MPHRVRYLGQLLRWSSSFRAALTALDGSGVRIVDCEPEALYARAHVPGAVLLPVDPFLKNAEGGPLNAADFEALCAHLSIGAETRVVFLDNHPSRLLSMRAAWIWRSFGHSAAHFLDGGWTAYVRSGRSVSVDMPEPPPVSAPVRARPQPGYFTPREAVLSAARAAVDSEGSSGPAGPSSRSLALLDARTPEEFSGADLRGNPRGGAIPGAVNVPYARLFEPGTGLLLPPHRLREAFVDAGLPADPLTPVATYCQLGIRAAVAAVALREAGFSGAAVYEGGAREWLSDPRLPVSD